MDGSQFLLGLATGLALATSAWAQVVISQIYPQGGVGECTAEGDFVEIHNTGASTASIEGWSIYAQYPDETEWSLLAGPLSGSLLAGEFRRFGPGPFDLNYIPRIGGKVILLNTDPGSIPDGTCPNDATVMDKVGWGATSVDCNEGGFNAVTTPNDCVTSIHRKLNGCEDTDDNSADFELLPANDSRLLYPCRDAVNISQVYLRPNVSTAVYSQRFVELGNASSSNISLTGWSLQLQSSGSNAWTSVPLFGTIAAGDYWVIATPEIGPGIPIPAPGPNQESTALPLDTAGLATGKIALVRNFAGVLPDGCPTGSPMLEDLVGFGSTAVVCREGAANAPVASPHTLSCKRRDCGCTDTDENGDDFESAPVSPRLSGSPLSIGPPFACEACAPFTITVSQQPEGACVAPGSPVTLQVTATQSPCPMLPEPPALRYWWRKNGAVIDAFGGTAAFQIPSASAADAGTYDVIVWHDCATVTSDPAVIIVSTNDCNSNGTLDECEPPANDCNANSVPDDCEPDCNTNGVADACDISSGASDDCDGNGAPDECELAGNDCNTNGVLDFCDTILTGTAALTASDAAAGDSFGAAVAISGETAVVGASLDDDAGSSSGSAYIFVRTDPGAPGWTQQAKLTASDGQAGDLFGNPVSLHAETAVIGAPLDDHGLASNAGSAYVFVRTSGVWAQQAKLIGSDTAGNDSFADAVSISGDSAVIGARSHDQAGSNSGAAYVFVRVGGAWTQQAKLIASDAAASDNFGAAVSIFGDTLVVGARSDSHAGGSAAGSAYVFVRAGSVWTQQAKLIAPDAAANDNFGGFVSLGGDTLVVGARQDTHSGVALAGSAYVFVRAGLAWTQQAKLIASDPAISDDFGSSVSISGNLVVVGAARDDHSGGSNVGSAYVFARTGPGAPGWTQQAKLTAPNAADGDSFGTVAIAGHTVLVGASSDDHAGGANAGSAYVLPLIADCNANGTPDECELATGDCNMNGHPDGCDIASGTSLDSDADGVPDECDLCPGTPPGANVNVDGCPIAPGDGDGDGDIDLADQEAFNACMTDPGTPAPPGCESFDFDGDGEVTLADWAAFQQCFSGAAVPPEPGCAD